MCGRREDLDLASRARRIVEAGFARRDDDLAVRYAAREQLRDNARSALCQLQILDQGGALVCETDDEHMNGEV
jgi:hypothetical protein